MANRIDKADLKKFFEAGDKPTEEQFASLIDETYNNDEASSQEISDMLIRVLS